jgi:magnesium chelatase subunit H
MLFMEDHIQAVLPALEARQADCDALVCCMSAAEVVRLTRIGGFKMDGSQKGPLSFLKKLRGTPKKGSVAGEQQMKMLRRLPKILRFIPGTAQDVRAYFLAMQYWLAGSDENLANLVRFLINRYADGERRSLRGSLKVAAPIEYPENGLYHPRLPQRIGTDLDALPAEGTRGTVGLLVMRSYVLSGGHGPLRRRHRRPRGPWPARDPGLRQRPRRSARGPISFSSTPPVKFGSTPSCP